MKAYRTKHRVEAARWRNANPDKKEIGFWFGGHGQALLLMDGTLTLMNGSKVAEGDWIVFINGDFIAMTDEDFRETYEEVIT